MNYKVLTCGSNGNYQLGTGDNEDHDKLQEVPLPPEAKLSGVRQFAFGGNHTFILLEDGLLFATGNNEHGQCGIPGPQTLFNFTKVTGSWKHVSAGWEFSVLCSMDNRVFTCGYGPKGELGLGPKITRAETLHDLKKEWKDVVAMELSINHTIVKLADGTFFGWGASRKHQMGEFPGVPNKKGDLKPLAQLWEPTKLNLTAESVKLGRERTLLLGESLRVIGKDPLEIDVRANKARAMWSSIHYSHEVDGSLVVSSVGNNSHGQLFQYDVPEKIVDFEVGSEHGILLTESGKVYAWGWGEHGNCGERKDDSVIFNFLNLIYNGTSKVTKMACGLATTWLVVE